MLTRDASSGKYSLGTALTRFAHPCGALPKGAVAAVACCMWSHTRSPNGSGRVQPPCHFGAPLPRCSTVSPSGRCRMPPPRHFGTPWFASWPHRMPHRKLQRLRRHAAISPFRRTYAHKRRSARQDPWISLGRLLRVDIHPVPFVV